MDIYEEHSREFLNYIASNEKELRKALKKNITYDAELFDDVTGETTLKIYEYINKNRKFINNFKNFYFICAKRNYITAQNKDRERKKNDDNDFIWNISHAMEKKANEDDVAIYLDLIQPDNDTEDKEEKLKNINRLIQYLQEELNKVFLPMEVDVFILYFRLKAEKKGISYKKMATIMDVDVKTITNIIQKLKKWTRNNPDILEMKKKLIDNDD